VEARDHLHSLKVTRQQFLERKSLQELEVKRYVICKLALVFVEKQRVKFIG
jgi:hypothetical protein